MFTIVKFAVYIVALAAACFAQDGLTIDRKHKERVPIPEVDKIYSSECSVVQREFDIGHPLHPQVKLVRGADKNEIRFAVREVRLCANKPLACELCGLDSCQQPFLRH